MCSYCPHRAVLPLNGPSRLGNSAWNNSGCRGCGATGRSVWPISTRSRINPDRACSITRPHSTTRPCNITRPCSTTRARKILTRNCSVLTGLSTTDTEHTTAMTAVRVVAVVDSHSEAKCWVCIGCMVSTMHSVHELLIDVGIIECLY